ncbi:MAG: hypothetical protein ACI89U_003176, partial [Gammaproteobacteria bacterium]
VFSVFSVFIVATIVLHASEVIDPCSQFCARSLGRSGFNIPFYSFPSVHTEVNLYDFAYCPVSIKPL